MASHVPLDPALAMAALFEGQPFALCGMDRSGTILMANRRCDEAAGMAHEGSIGADWRTLFAASERRDRLLTWWEAAARGEPVEPFEARSRTGRQLLWHFGTWPALAGGVSAVAIDTSEERDARTRFRAHERVTTLAHLGAGLAHRLRNPLNSAGLQLALAQRKLARIPGTEHLATNLDDASREVTRTAAVLDDFLALAHPPNLLLEHVPLARVVADAVTRVGGRARALGVDVASQLAPAVRVSVDRARLEDAIYHLLANAVDAAAGAARKEVVIRCQAVDGNAVVEVEDHGPGFAQPGAPLFDPFYSTKPEGTGLGLAIVERVATDHGGVVEAFRTDSTTVFRLRLPALPGAVAAPLMSGS